MQNEKIALIALIVIIAAALSIFLIATYQGDIFENLFPPAGNGTGDSDTVERGDCVDVHYIGRYASNNTIFDTSYDTPENKSGGQPLNIFIPSDTQTTPPDACQGYTSNMIPGFLNQLVGLEVGETHELDPIPPEEGYGEEFDVGDSITTPVFNQNLVEFTDNINQTLQVTEKTSDFIEMLWTNPPDEFTLPTLIIFGSLNLTDPTPSYDDAIKMAPPFAIWPNATEIIETNDTYYLTRTTPTSTESLTENITQIPLDLLGEETLFIFPDATNVTYNDTTITFNQDPEEGKVYAYAEESMFGTVNIELTVNNVTSDIVNISVFVVEYNQTQSYEIQRVSHFNRTFMYPRTYRMDLTFLQQALPQFEMALQNEGYSLNRLAGETLVFEVTIEDIIKS